MSQELPPRLVTTDVELQHAAELALAAGSIGFDTEFMREKTYRARLCLVQAAVDRQIFIIDPLAELGLDPIAQLLADPQVEVIVHAGRQDFELFHELFGTVPNRVFDVQLAAGFVGYGANLPYGRLVESVVRTKPTKGESYSDWCRRPLTAAQLDYAADDVRFLGEIAAQLKRRLGELERGDWLQQEMTAFESKELYETDPGEMWRRVSGRGTLSDRQTGVLKEVAAWREVEARRRDLPRGWIVKDPTLVEIARRQPTGLAQLKAIRGLNAREAERSGAEILKAIERGRKAPAITAPSAAPRDAQARARMLSGLADAVVRARCERARIATELVATRGELEELLARALAGQLDHDRHRLLHGWRRQLAGDSVLALASGKIGVRVIDRPPYLEEIPLE